MYKQTNILFQEQQQFSRLLVQPTLLKQRSVLKTLPIVFHTILFELLGAKVGRPESEVLDSWLMTTMCREITVAVGVSG